MPRRGRRDRLPGGGSLRGRARARLPRLHGAARRAARDGARRADRRAGHELHVGDDRPPEGRAPPPRAVRSRRRRVALRHVPRDVRHRAARRQRAPDRLAALPHRRSAVHDELAALRPHGRSHGPLDTRALPRVHRAVSRHDDAHGADAVSPVARAAGRREGPLRRVLAPPRDPRRRALPRGREAADARVVGPRDLRVLRGERGRRHARHARRVAPPSGHRRPRVARLRDPRPRRRGQRLSAAAAGHRVHGARRTGLRVSRRSLEDRGKPS